MTPDRSASNLANSPPSPEMDARAARILIVEDDVHTRTIMERRLSKNGYRVESAEDGVIGLAKARAIHPDIIISDWMMPNMDGHELCARIKNDPEFGPLIFILLTAKDAREDKIEALDAGADEYLVKPCDPNELLARVRAAERIVTLQKSLAEKNRELEAAMERINHELKVTSEIQRALLPQELLEVPGYSFAAYYRPSTECSGDYYDLIDLGEGRIAAIIADVSGHGTPAMVAMALTRSLVRLYAPGIDSPAAMLAKINATLYEQLPTTQFVTAFYAIIETQSGRVRYSSAGQNPPLWLDRGAGRARYLTNCEGFPLKLVDPAATYDDFEMRLAPGEDLLLYTDGIPEAQNPELEQFENDRLIDAALAGAEAEPSGVLDEIVRHLISFAAGAMLRDDVSMLLISRR